MSPEEEAQRALVVAEARTWIGTPYHHRAHVKGAGVDCLFLLVGIWQEVRLVGHVEVPYYPPDWMMHQKTEQYVRGLERYGKKTEEMLPGNIVVWKVGKDFSHSGIIIDWPKIIHASNYDRMVAYGDASKDHRLLSNRDGSPRERVVYSFW